MTEEYISFTHRWVRWNLRQEGDSTAKDGAGEWYRGDTYFNNDQVWRRFVKNGRGKPLILTKSLWSYAAGAGHIDEVPIMYVPCVGVFSRFPDDCLPMEALHERNKFLILSRIIHVVYEEVPKYNGQFWAKNDYSTQNFKEKVKGVLDAWRHYSDTFRLNWGQLPPIYEMSYKESVESKVRSYMDPKEVNKRERAVARRIAKQAFDKSGG